MYALLRIVRQTVLRPPCPCNIDFATCAVNGTDARGELHCASGPCSAAAGPDAALAKQVQAPALGVQRLFFSHSGGGEKRAADLIEPRSR